MGKKIINVIIIFIVVISSISVLDIYSSILMERKENNEALVGVLDKQDSKDLDNYRNEFNNDELIGMINIPGTKINTLFAQANDNQFYLRHNLKKEYNRLGSIFLDARNTLNDKQLNLYAHNSIIYDNAPFRGLTDYVDPEFAESNDIVNITTENWTRRYQIVSVKQTNDQEHMTLLSKNFKIHIEKIRASSLYDNRDLTVEEWDNILILQTCAMNEKKEIIVILAKEV